MQQPADASAIATSVCAGCGTEIPPVVLACPQCDRLVHGEDLRRLAAAADQATRAGDHTRAIASWRSALELLPPASRQHVQIAARIEALALNGQQSPGNQ
ncbi:MAG TPA: hypothetical protein VK524_09955, partial [Polyangiaceae bacterium]|nr:hypothetical protein [Polyangiaceae bacterium]